MKSVLTLLPVFERPVARRIDGGVRRSEIDTDPPGGNLTYKDPRSRLTLKGLDDRISIPRIDASIKNGRSVLCQLISVELAFRSPFTEDDHLSRHQILDQIAHHAALGVRGKPRYVSRRLIAHESGS